MYQRYGMPASLAVLTVPVTSLLFPAGPLTDQR